MGIIYGSCRAYMEITKGFYEDNGKETGNCYLGFRVIEDLGFPFSFPFDSPLLGYYPYIPL